MICSPLQVLGTGNESSSQEAGACFSPVFTVGETATKVGWCLKGYWLKKFPQHGCTRKPKEVNLCGSYNVFFFNCVCAHAHGLTNIKAAAQGPEALDPLELEAQVVLRHHMGAGNQTGGLCKSSQCSYPLSWFSSLTICLKYKNRPPLHSCVRL